jgi:hypothetical protein
MVRELACEFDQDRLFEDVIISPPSTSKEIHPMGEPPKKKFDTGEKKTIVIINYQKIWIQKPPWYWLKATNRFRERRLLLRTI